jgi:cytochrome P450
LPKTQLQLPILLCLGAHLAREEARVAIGEFVWRVPEPELDAGGIEWGTSLFRVLGRLPVCIR